MFVSAVVDHSLSRTSPLGDSLEVFVRREDAEHFIEEVRGDEPELASSTAARQSREKRVRLCRERAGSLTPC
jgi:hypothetical protein